MPARPFRPDNPAWPLLLAAGRQRLCQCGAAARFPQCDGSGDCARQAHVVDLPKSRYVWVCGCGHSATPPWCDGSHAKPPFRD